MLRHLTRDVAYSLRQMRRAPAFASAAVTSLALAISPWDPLTFGSIAAALLGVTLAATVAAARRD